MEERCVIIYVRSGDNVLLINKKRGHGAGKVNAPGGHIEPGETPVQAAIRECMEETGIIPVEPVLKGVLDFPFADGMHLKGYVFTADNFFGTMCDSEEPTRSGAKFHRCLMTRCGRTTRCGFLPCWKENTLQARSTSTATG